MAGTRNCRLTPQRRDLLIRLVAHRDAVPLRLTDLAKQVGMPITTLHYHLNALVVDGHLSHTGWGATYTPTEKGIEACVEKPPRMPDGKARSVYRCPGCGHVHYT